MLNPADNELLVRVGPGTPMGELLRRFWTPVMLAEELSEPDGPPVRVKVLGEKLVAFRDTNGLLGLLETYCAHRRANLFWGRNEEWGLRCAYHGWKYDVRGQCVDLPNADEGDTLKHKVKIRAYPTIEHGGLIWAYLGPSEKMPKFPHYDIFDGPASHRDLRKLTGQANWVQIMEGDIDSSHITFLHSRVDGKPNLSIRDEPQNVHALADKSPRWTTRETEYGVMLAAGRKFDDAHSYWRINHWLMPYCTLIASPNNRPIIGQIRVPMDDENTLHFRVFFNRGAPLSEEDRAYSNKIVFPEVIPGTFRLNENRDNDYQIDRAVQKTMTFSGIKSVVAQDLAVTEDQDGPIFDRSRERLTSADAAIIAVRRRLIGAAKALQKGIEPAEASHPEAYRIRSCQITLPNDVDVQTGALEVMLAGV